MFLEPTILSIIIAKLRGGSLRRLGDVYIRGWYLLILSGALQIVMSILKSRDSSFSNMIMENYFVYLHALSYLLLVVAILLNISKLSMKIFLFGLILNCIVIFSNGGRMPVAIDGVKGNNNHKIEIKDSDIKHEAMIKDTRMPYLADIIPIPYPLPKIISVGDIFLICGVFIFFQEAMVKTKTFNRPIKMIGTIR